MTTSVGSIQAVRDLETTTADATAVARELIDIHCRAGHCVAELSESPAWAHADGLTIELITEASAVAGRNARAPATHVPAVVRCRELAAAERTMVAALDGIGLVNVDAGAVVRSRKLLDELAEMCETLRQ